MSTVSGETVPGGWTGGAAVAYREWAHREERLVDALARALAEAEAEIAAGGDDLAQRLALITLPSAAAPARPAAVPVGFEPVAPQPGGTGAAPSTSAAERDRRNRARLAADLRELRGRRRSGAETERLQRLEGLAARLAELDARRDPVTGRQLTVQLFDYDGAAFRGDGRAVVSIGDLDTADDVGVLVPGMGTTLGSIGALTGDAERLYGAARRIAPHRTVATVAWIGYDAPSGRRTPAVARTDGARAGGERLRADLRDLVATRGDRDPHLVLFGHSYGSTTSAYAAADGALRDVVDDLVLLGSPGAGPVTTAAEFGLPGEVYVAKHRDDPVTRFGGVTEWGKRIGLHVGLGVDPSTAAFGAIPLPAGSVPGVSPHSSYYQEESVALEAFAQVLVGERR